MCITLRNCDCLEYMRTVPDNYYDVCIADPPYGIGRDWEKRDWRSRAKYKGCRYMNVRPPKEFFDEMRRISKDWRVWGWNYFTDILPPTNYLIVWDKMSNSNPVFKYSKCEIAGTSFRVPCNLVSCGWDGYRMGSETGTEKIHPHQKPVDLYRWILGAYLADPRGHCCQVVACLFCLVLFGLHVFAAFGLNLCNNVFRQSQRFQKFCFHFLLAPLRIKLF